MRSCGSPRAAGGNTVARNVGDITDAALIRGRSSSPRGPGATANQTSRRPARRPRHGLPGDERREPQSEHEPRRHRGEDALARAAQGNRADARPGDYRNRRPGDGGQEAHRPPPRPGSEEDGLDLLDHGEAGYHLDDGGGMAEGHLAAPPTAGLAGMIEAGPAKGR
jgi:hypothetical protein